jgi:hypothetical protein
LTPRRSATGREALCRKPYCREDDFLAQEAGCVPLPGGLLEQKEVPRPQRSCCPVARPHLEPQARGDTSPARAGEGCGRSRPHARDPPTSESANASPSMEALSGGAGGAKAAGSPAAVLSSKCDSPCASAKSLTYVNSCVGTRLVFPGCRRATHAHGSRSTQQPRCRPAQRRPLAAAAIDRSG